MRIGRGMGLCMWLWARFVGFLWGRGEREHGFILVLGGGVMMTLWLWGWLLLWGWFLLWFWLVLCWRCRYWRRGCSILILTEQSQVSMHIPIQEREG